MRSVRQISGIKTIAFVLAALPLVWAAAVAAQSPDAFDAHFSGDSAEMSPVFDSTPPCHCAQRIVEPQGCDCGEGTIWLDPLPDDCRNPVNPLPPAADSSQGILDRLRGHGPIGMVNDPLFVPEAGIPAECDEIDVGPDTPWDESLKRWWTRDLEIFGGIDGFKGPFDQGQNANFGIHEGLNFGAPLGIFDWGWQIGAEATQSNFTGNDPSNPQAVDRNQFFVTGGLFKRARDWGFQWGLVYDYLHDVYYAKADLKQIRSDTSFLFPGGMHELGYFGAYGTGGGNYVLLDRQLKYFIYMEPTDVFALYYRRYFDGGGDGRIWLGMSGNGDGLIGGEIRVPMGKNWELENRFNYLIPKQGNGTASVSQESWGVTIDLVFYVGHPARCERYHPYRPMLNVADNTLFMTNTFIPTTPP
jgi:hypothetical protein